MQISYLKNPKTGSRTALFPKTFWAEINMLEDELKSLKCVNITLESSTMNNANFVTGFAVALD